MPVVALLEGDGIGPEVCREAEKVLVWASSFIPGGISIVKGLIGGAAIEEVGVPLPEATLRMAQEADAVLLGAVGGEQWDQLPSSRRPEAGLLAIRKEMGLFANLRPAIACDALLGASSLKEELVRGLDILIVRELTGDVYFGQPRGVETLADGSRRGVNTMVYTTEEIRRIGRVAFELARVRGGRVCSVDKANVLECTALWREEMQRLHDQEFADIALSHMYVDNAAMQLVRAPKQFDVLVTGNMFGDILSDCAAMLTGSLGMLPSASLGARSLENTEAASGATAQPALYEPVHGSAPDIAGRGIANPLGAILSVAMMLRYSFDKSDLASAVEDAVYSVLALGMRTADLVGSGVPVGTSVMGDAVVRALSGRTLAEGV